ncbi:hypothetical protein LPJ59_006978, partial [Coemansia sp. RSA 2399]
MSEYGDDPGTAGKLPTSAWLSVPSPRTLLDRTTKFVLNAAHGKSRSLIPTTDDASLDATDFAETSVQAEGDDVGNNNALRIDDTIDLIIDESAAFDRESGQRQQQQQQQKRQQKQQQVENDRDEQTLVVPEVDVLLGKWNAFHILSTTSNNDIGADEREDYDNRPATPPGMLRIRR